jgi:hypothetical protein
MRDIITKLEELNVEKPQLNEGLADMAHEAEKDHEVQMARSDCYKSAKYAVAIHKMLKDVSEMEGIDGWVAAKITKAADYLGSVKHYMEGQAMSDVELAVVPVAGDMTDAMTVPQESINEGFGPPSNGAKNIQELISKMGADTPGDIIADIMHWADANDMEFSDLVRQGTMYYNDEKMMYNDDGDDEVTEAESIVEGRLGFRDLEMFGSEIASRIDQEARRRGSADMEPGDADQLRYMIAREMGLVEDAVNEDREVMVRATNIDYDGPALDKLPTDVNVKVMVNPGDSEDEIFDMVADELEDRYGVKVSGFDMKMMEDQDIEEDEDIIGNIIGKLAQPKVGSKGGKDVIGDIIAKLPKDSDEKTVNMPSLPKSKPERTPTVSAVAQQAAANKAVRSMAQDTTRPLTQSKFSEWSKK